MRFLSFLARLIRPKPKANAQAAAVLAASEPIRLAFAPGEAPTLKSSTCKVIMRLDDEIQEAQHDSFDSTAAHRMHIARPYQPHET